MFINRRIVKDRTIAHAIIDAYSMASIKERSPEVHLFIEMAPDALDVNVHPTKAEVRFRDQSLVHEVVRRALMDALGHSGAPQLQLRRNTRRRVRSRRRFRRPVERGMPESVDAGRAISSGVRHDVGRVGHLARRAAQRRWQAGVDPRIKPMIPLGQFRDTFIIAVDDDGVAIIDQHVAHERVLFEQVMERLTAGRLESQRLLVPLVLEVAPSAHQALVTRANELEQFGFEIESFGSATIKVAAVPAVLKIEDSSRALLALAEDLEGLDRGAQVQDALQRIAATTACHAAVKANYPLTYEKMAHILDELRATAHRRCAPAGRVMRLTRRRSKELGSRSACNRCPTRVRHHRPCLTPL